MTEHIVLIGAGSAMFTQGLVADIIRVSEPCTVSLVDIDPDALETADRLVRKMVAARQAPITVNASVDRRDVLPGATAVICTVGVGGRRAWEQDVYIPRKYGIFQPVGDSVMPGGTSRALRMIPPMVEIARDVLELAPRALFFNYGNPMGPVCRGVRKATGAEMVGLCHGVNDVAGFIARELGVPRGRMRYTAAGMNHLTWFTEVRVDGQDAMPRLREIAREKLARLPQAAGLGARFAESGTSGRDTPPEELLPFTWQLLLLFGGFPAVLDRHVTEFFPALYRDGNYYGKTLGVDTYSVEETIAWGDQIYARMRELALSDDPLPEDYFGKAGGEHEQVIDIIDSIRTDAGRVYSANLPNRGQIPNFPPEAIVESPCVADAAGLRPVALPPLPSGIAGTLTGRLAWVETTVDAALDGSRELFIQALVNDGSVDSLDKAAALADELLAVQAPYLPRFAREAG